jgi:hypothetical protein
MTPKRLFTCFVFASLLVCGRAQEWDWIQRFQGDNSGGTSIALDGQREHLRGDQMAAGSSIQKRLPCPTDDSTPQRPCI